MSFMAISNPYLSLVSVEDIQRNPCIFSNDKTSFLLARMDTIAQDDGTAIAIRTYPVGTSSISSVFLNHYQIYFDNNRFMVMSGVSDVFRLYTTLVLDPVSKTVQCTIRFQDNIVGTGSISQYADAMSSWINVVSDVYLVVTTENGDVPVPYQYTQSLAYYPIDADAPTSITWYEVMKTKSVLPIVSSSSNGEVILMNMNEMNDQQQVSVTVTAMVLGNAQETLQNLNATSGSEVYNILAFETTTSKDACHQEFICTSYFVGQVVSSSEKHVI